MLAERIASALIALAAGLSAGLLAYAAGASVISLHDVIQARRRARAILSEPLQEAE